MKRWKGPEIVQRNSSKHRKHAVLRLPKQKRKYASLFEQQSSPDIMIVLHDFAKLQMSCDLLFMCENVFYFLFLRCDATTQQGRDLCDLYRAWFGNDVAHFLFV